MYLCFIRKANRKKQKNETKKTYVFLFRMAGLYIHIPFCAKRCLYCDFFSNTEMKYKTPYLDALIREMEQRKAYLEGERLETIYFGGGTPSQLAPADFERLFEAIYRHFDAGDCREITLEANPDDMTAAYAAAIARLPFNRVSMGVQSFDETDLAFLNRRHTARQAIEAVENCRAAGIDNLSIDLIYGLPGQTEAGWEANLRQALALDVPHLSAYHLIYEEGTALYKLKEAGKVQPVAEEASLCFFNLLIDRLTAAGYLHYEISNFARPGSLSQHNSAYWTGKKYLGLGPSAHSYNGKERQWNVAYLPAYLKGIATGQPAVEKEPLDARTRYNDYIITGLRTMWGIDLAVIQAEFGREMRLYCERQTAAFARQGLLRRRGDTLVLSREGIFVSDGIMSDLLKV